MDVVIRNLTTSRCHLSSTTKGFLRTRFDVTLKTKFIRRLIFPRTVETLLTYLWTFPLISSFVTFQLSISLVCC